IKPVYSFNLTGVQNELVDAMLHPITQFHLENGSAAPTGLFNNTFGCAALGKNGQCSTPVPQTVPIVYWTGDTVDQAILTQIASVVNNVSATYNMGLTVSVVPLPQGLEAIQGFSGQLYMWATAGYVDYPWVADPMQYMLAPGGFWPGPDGWNLTSLGSLNLEMRHQSSINNLSGILSVSNLMNTIANKAVMYLWTFYPKSFQVVTSNIQGYYFNPALYGNLQYFPALY
ncbi:MAG: hypothetical protein OK457_06495, partial [Thaumarchaeota archaeon]|nr:hypothetical protein [Nitrososphaerota archaeon]